MSDRNKLETEHAWIEERLSAYIDDKLAPLERAQLERHLRDCARCQASLASLRWTVALAKQVPAPTLPRAFTLPVPAPARRAPAYGFGFARLATVVATLLLFAVVGVDLIAQRGGGFASAPVPAALQNAEKPTSIALAPAVDQAKAATPSAAPEKLQAAPTAAPLPTLAAQPAAPPAPAAVGTLPAPRAPTGGPVAPVTTTTTFAAGAASIATPVPATPMLLPTATVAIPSATASPSPTSAAQALVQPTRAQLPAGGEIETAQPLVTPLRVAEIGLVFLAVFFGSLTILLRRKK